MENILPILGLATIGSIAGLMGGLVMTAKRSWSKAISVHSIPFAAGVMMAVSLLDILPEAIEGSNAKDVLFVVLVVMVAVFFFEQLFIHIHHHGEHERTTLKTSATLANIGDTIHNYIDGLAIAASFLVDPKLGVLVAIATFLHEIPHEIGDFGLMLAAGWSRKRVILVNLITACATYLGVITVLVFATTFEGNLSTLLAVAGGLFLYIGASDLLPEVHSESHDNPWHQASLLLFGVMIIWLALHFLPEH